MLNKETLLPLIYIFFLMLGPLASYSQNSTQDQKINNNFLGIGLGVSGDLSQFGFSEINREFVGSGLPPINLGTSFIFIPKLYFGPVSNSLKVLAELRYGSGSDVNNNANYSSKLKFNFFDANLHYTIWHNKRSILSPSIGFGIMEYKLNVYNKNNLPSDFQNSLTDFRGELHLKATNNLYSNLSLNYKWEMSSGGNLFFELHGGYRLKVRGTKWQLSNGNKLNGAPSASPGGYSFGAGIILQ